MAQNFDEDCRHVGRVVTFASAKNFHLGARLASRLSFLDGVEVEVSCCFLVIFFLLAEVPKCGLWRWS